MMKIPESNHPQFPHLFSPWNLRGVPIKNRVVVSGHFAGWWIDGGLPSAAFESYIEERAKGGVGLFVIGATSPMPGSGWLENISDEIIPRYAALVEAGHRIAQLSVPRRAGAPMRLLGRSGLRWRILAPAPGPPI